MEFILDFFTFTKEITKSCDEFEQVNSGRLIYIYSAARANQFEMKNTCFEFVINVSPQGDNVKIKLNLKINLQRLILIFYKINENISGLCLVFSEAYS